MNKDFVIDSVVKIVENKLQGDCTGHDWFHVYRVCNNAIEIAKKETENVDLFVVQLGALLHDIADWKFNNGDENAGAVEAKKILESLNVDTDIIEKVTYIVGNVSFKGSKVESKMNTIEGKIVQDADRLDAMGAIGIARVFAYGGSNNREIYNPDIKPNIHSSFEEYKKNNSPSVNHFYEKLLLIKDMMNTETGKKIAEERHRFMEEYLDRFYKEWEGKM